MVSHRKKRKPVARKNAAKPEKISGGRSRRAIADPRGPKSKTRGRPRKSPADTEERRRQILAAALEVFSEHGYEAARLDEIARKAKVAKGTLYLYFTDKQAIFEALVRSAAQPVLGRLEALSEHADMPAAHLFENLFKLFRREILQTDRKLVVRLVISEGARFPELADFYHREVISHVMATFQTVARHAHKNGQLATDGPVKFPQLIAAPLLLSLIWDGIFERSDHLNVKGFFAAHIALLTKTRSRR